MTSNIAVYVYVGSCVCDSDFCSEFCFQCEGTIFYEERIRKSYFSVALQLSIAVALCSCHVRKTLSSLAFFLPIFTT